MRILAIRGCNLASLADPFELDFEAPPLSRTGLFAITGPTGSGKSTILDALCIALFDRMPRLPAGSGVAVGRAEDEQALRIKSNDVRSILRRGSGSGYAEVEFIGGDRRRYRARWEVRRARNRPGGRLQPQTLSLQDLQTGQTLGQGKTETLALIVERLGLNFEQFRRSVLLAQGDFAAFLKASAGERSSLLERITGTRLYSELSRAAFTRATEESERLRRLQERLNDQLPLEEEQRTGLLQALDGVERQLQSLEPQRQRLQQEQHWHDGLQRLQQALAEAEIACTSARALWREAGPRRQQLQLIEAAWPLRPLLERWDETRVRKAEARQQLQRLQQEQASAVEQEAEQAGDHERAKAALESAERADRELAPVLVRARGLDTRIDARKEHIDQLETERGQAEQGLLEIRKYINKSLQLIGNKEIILEEIDRWLVQNPCYGILASEWSRWQADLQRLQSGHAAVTDAGNSLLENQQRLHELDEKLDGMASRQLQLQQEIAALNQRLLDIALQARSEQILSLRQQLQDQQPCPVCGSPDHPWGGEDQAPGRQLEARQKEGAEREGGSGRSLVEETKWQGREQVEAVAVERRRLDGLQEQLSQLNGAISEKRQQRGGLVQALSGLQQQISNLGQEQEQLQIRLADPLAGIGDWYQRLQAEGDHFLEQCDRQVQAWRDANQERARVMDELARSRNGMEGLQLRVVDREALRDRLQQSLAQELETLDRLQQQRAALLEGRQVDEVEAERSSIMSQSRQSAAAAATASHQAESKRAVAQQAVEHWQGQLEQCSRLYQSADQRLTSALAASDMTRESLIQRLDRDPRWFESERLDIDQLQQDLGRTETVLTERQGRLTIHQQSAPQRSLEQLQAEWQQLQQAQQALQEQQARLRADLQQDDERRRRSRTLREELRVQQQRWRCWAGLSDVIGSHDGKKFRSFAQGLTLDALLAHANEQIQELAGRYRLQRVPGSDLEIQVIDRDMGDEVRSVHSLSGGESFLVSLALALGLASLSSDQIQVESLFIDEGFGSLDQETLDMTIASLDALQSLGRKVGVISHVPVLVERIGVRVVVQRQGEGRGRVRTEVA